MSEQPAVIAPSALNQRHCLEPTAIYDAVQVKEDNNGNGDVSGHRDTTIETNNERPAMGDEHDGTTHNKKVPQQDGTVSYIYYNDPADLTNKSPPNEITVTTTANKTNGSPNGYHAHSNQLKIAPGLKENPIELDDFDNNDDDDDGKPMEKVPRPILNADLLQLKVVIQKSPSSVSSTPTAVPFNQSQHGNIVSDAARETPTVSRKSSDHVSTDKDIKVKMKPVFTDTSKTSDSKDKSYNSFVEKLKELSTFRRNETEKVKRISQKGASAGPSKVLDFRGNANPVHGAAGAKWTHSTKTTDGQQHHEHTRQLLNRKPTSNHSDSLAHQVTTNNPTQQAPMQQFQQYYPQKVQQPCQVFQYNSGPGFQSHQFQPSLAGTPMFAQTGHSVTHVLPPFAQLPPQNLSKHILHVHVIDSPLLKVDVFSVQAMLLSSSDYALLTLLEVFSFQRRMRNNSYDPVFTPTAAAFLQVYNSRNPKMSNFVPGICCLACKRRVMERREFSCPESAVVYPSCPNSFLQSLHNLRAHVMMCPHVSPKDKAYVTGVLVLPGHSGNMSMHSFVNWYCKSRNMWNFALTADTERAAIEKKQRQMDMDVLKRENDERYQHLQDAITFGFAKGHQAHLDYPLISSLLDVPVLSQHPDTPIGLLALDSLELLLVRRDRALLMYKPELDTLSFDFIAIIQCKYCHGRCRNGLRDLMAVTHVAGDGSSDSQEMTKFVMALFYAHSHLCYRAPTHITEKVLSMRPYPRTDRFNTFALNMLSRCEDVNSFLEKSAKKVQPEEDFEIWVSPSPIVLAKIIREKGRDAFLKVSEPPTVPGCMVRDVEEFPRIGLLHGGVSSEASTKVVLSKRQRTPWSGNCSRVIDEEIVLAPFHLAQASSPTPSKKARRSPISVTKRAAIEFPS